MGSVFADDELAKRAHAIRGAGGDGETGGEGGTGSGSGKRRRKRKTEREVEVECLSSAGFLWRTGENGVQRGTVNDTVCW